MILYIVRHAYAGERGDPRYADDSLRPLTSKGRKQFRRAVKKLAKRGLQPSVIATSPLVRCRQTAETMIDVLGCVELFELTDLAPGSNLEALVAWTLKQTADQIAWVGHAPDVDHLAGALVGEPAEAIHFAKGAIAAIEFDEAIAPGKGKLCWLITPKIMGS